MAGARVTRRPLPTHLQRARTVVLVAIVATLGVSVYLAGSTT